VFSFALVLTLLVIVFFVMPYEVKFTKKQSGI
jgi:hypothetical protein